jgi:hypothetical protein
MFSLLFNVQRNAARTRSSRPHARAGLHGAGWIDHTYKTITAADPLMSLIGSTSRIVDHTAPARTRQQGGGGGRWLAGLAAAVACDASSREPAAQSTVAAAGGTMEDGAVSPPSEVPRGGKAKVKPQKSRELKPHRPEYSDVGFLSDAEMSERRSKRCGLSPNSALLPPPPAPIVPTPLIPTSFLCLCGRCCAVLQLARSPAYAPPPPPLLWLHARRRPEWRSSTRSRLTCRRVASRSASGSRLSMTARDGWCAPTNFCRMVICVRKEGAGEERRVCEILRVGK